MSGSGSVARPRCIAIVGPTASGKTGLAIEVARSLSGEIVSMDSRQAYRGFRVGTAAPTDEELSRAPHHGVGILEPDERYGAGRFAELAASWLDRIEARGNVPILAGGTGLFLRALTHPMFREPEADPARRDAIRRWLDRRDEDELARWASRLDPDTPSDPQRAGRTVELSLLSGRPLSWWLEHGEPERSALAVAVFAIELPADALRARIERRARRLIESGAWEAEVRSLERAGHARSRAFDALGYADVRDLVHGRIDRETAIERIFRSTWAYARRQRTWFRHQLPEGASRLDGSEPTEQLARRIRREWRHAGRRRRAGPTPENTGRS